MAGMFGEGFLEEDGAATPPQSGSDPLSVHRAALSDTVSLCRSLHRQGHTEQLQAAEDKFTMEPLKVESLKDVEDLSDLVQLQR